MSDVASTYDFPRGTPGSSARLSTATGTAPPTSTAAAAAAGIYNIPRAILVEDASTPEQSTAAGPPDSTPRSVVNPFELYDVPRPTSMSPDEEGIYDDPLDIVDLEIYDYPPDAMEFALPPPIAEDSGMETMAESKRSSTMTEASDYTLTNRVSTVSMSSEDSFRPRSFSSITPSPRPSMALSMSSDDYPVSGVMCIMCCVLLRGLYMYITYGIVCYMHRYMYMYLGYMYTL